MKKLIALFILLPSICSAATIGIVTDIHIGKQNKRHTRTSASPEEKLSFFQDALTNLEGKAEALIVCGDMTDKGSKTYAQSLKNVADNSSLKTIWVKGNNDKKSFGVFSGAKYYFHDTENVRIIVMDTNQKIGRKQLTFLRRSLATNKNVVIAMHQPPYSAGSKKYMKKYKEFRKALTPNVKYIVSGHWETTWNHQSGDIKYKVISPLWRKGRYVTIEI